MVPFPIPIRTKKRGNEIEPARVHDVGALVICALVIYVSSVAHAQQVDSGDAQPAMQELGRVVENQRQLIEEQSRRIDELQRQLDELRALIVPSQVPPAPKANEASGETRRARDQTGATAV